MVANQAVDTVQTRFNPLDSTPQTSRNETFFNIPVQLIQRINIWCKNLFRTGNKLLGNVSIDQYF
jgi:hypothetical protein